MKTIKDILLKHYGNPIGGDNTTQWYVNDEAEKEIKEVICKKVDDPVIKRFEITIKEEVNNED